MYSEFITSFSISRDMIDKFELLIGFHPKEKRFLEEREDSLAINFIKFVDQTKLSENDYKRDYQKLAKLHLDIFPELKTNFCADDIIQFLWRKYIDFFEIIELGYIFPKDFGNNYWIENEEAITRKNAELRQEIDKRTNDKIRGTGKISWTLNFPTNGFLGQLIETQAGVSKKIKENYSLLNYPSGIIARCLKNKEISELVSPNQFEQIVGKIFEYDGWKIVFTKKTRDGGKDIVASKIDTEGNNHIAYVEAKRHSYQNKVGIGIVKQFFATVFVDNVKGFLVTSSSFTEPAKRFLNDNYICTTHIEMYDKQWLFHKINTIAEKDMTPYLINK